MNTILKDVREALSAQGDVARSENAQRFFKEPVALYGVTSAAVRAIAKQGLARLKGVSKQEVFTLCEQLWQSGLLEEGGIACEWSYAMRKQYVPEDLALFGTWLEQYVNNWASCDTLCNHSVGALLTTFPECAQTVFAWSQSANRWKKRGAAVSLIIPARNGLFVREALNTADALLRDPDDMIQKGYGWLLKVASVQHPEEVYAFILERKHDMPRTALRYALEKYPKDLRTKAMKA